MERIKEYLRAVIDIPQQAAMNIRNYLIRGNKIKTFYSKGLADVESVNLPSAKIPLHIVTVTYNNELLLNQQVRLMQKYITDEFVFVVADNSPDPEKRKKIKEVCISTGTTYISLPVNPYKTSSSSHGICLNWLCKNYISVFKPGYFGFIDHDLYPVKKHSVISRLMMQPVYGHWQGQKNYWYLWAGMCFFNATQVDYTKLDFLPASIGGKYADTGGSNWKLLYSRLEKDKISFPSHEYINLREGDVPQSDKMELIGEWLHSFNGSYWMKVETKENVLMDYLNKI